MRFEYRDLKHFVRILFIAMVTLNQGVCHAQNLDFPPDFRNDKILVYVLTSEELIASMTREYERVHKREDCLERADQVRNTSIPNNRLQIGDTYGIMFDLTLMDWLNETIEKATEKRKDKELIPVNQYNLKAYDVKDYKYVLKYKFLMDENFPPSLRMVFYLHDRTQGKELIDYDSPNQLMTFIPIICYSGKGDLFYGTIRRYKTAKQIRSFLEKTL